MAQSLVDGIEAVNGRISLHDASRPALPRDVVLAIHVLGEGRLVPARVSTCGSFQLVSELQNTAGTNQYKLLASVVTVAISHERT